MKIYVKQTIVHGTTNISAGVYQCDENFANHLIRMGVATKMNECQIEDKMLEPVTENKKKNIHLRNRAKP